MRKKLLMGNEAFAYAALQAGVRVVAGYPGTPSSELIETMAKLHAEGVAEGVHVEWSTNEKAALEMLAGASMAGARVLFTAKQVGLNVASDPLMSLNYVSVKGGFVLFVADDPGPISSQTEQDTRRFADFAKVPVFDPSTPEEGYAMMLEAFELSEKYGTPVIVRPTTRIDHASTFFEVPEHTVAKPLIDDGFQRNPDHWVIFPKRSFAAHGEIWERLGSIKEDFSACGFNPIDEYGDEPAKGILCGGISAAYAREAIVLLAEACEKADVELPSFRLMQVGTPYPFPESRVLEFADGLEDILVFEELDHVLEDGLLKLAGSHHIAYNVHGKLDGATLFRGENSTEDCLARIAGFLGVDTGQVKLPAPFVPTQDADDSPAPEPAVRPPVLCAGCPHRGSFYAVKKALAGRDAVLCGDIGCYTLGNAKPLDAVDTCLCMGAGITMAQGFVTAEPDRKCVAFVGDSTFFASGLTGVANAVYNQHDITVCVLDNSTTAMTGSQPHPGTGQTLMGPKSEPIQIEAVMKALGVKCIQKANPFYFEEARAAAQRAIDYPGPAALIFEAPCIQLVRSDKPAVVDTGLCVGCRKCITQIGCPAISMTGGPENANRGIAKIDVSLCYGCGLCTDICPFGALTTAAREEGREPYSDASHVSPSEGGEYHA